MQYKLGNSKRIYEQGETVNIECPNCNERANFSVFSNSNTKLISQFPLIDFKNVYLLVCPNCASTFSVENSVGKNFKKDKFALGDFDLKPLEQFNKK